MAPERKGAKKKKGNAEEESAVKPELVQLYTGLRHNYLFLCNRYFTDPIPTVKHKIDESLQTGKPLNQLLFNQTPKLKPADIVCLSKTFNLYDQLKILCFWKVQFEQNALKLLMDFSKKPQITHLELVDCGLKPNDAFLIGEALRTSVGLKTIVLDHNPMQDQSSAIFQGLASNIKSQVKKLSMRFCMIPFTCQSSIALLLTKTTTLAHLDLEGNSLRDAGLKQLVIPVSELKTLESLGLANNDIHDTTLNGCSHFAQMCISVQCNTKISFVDFSGNFIDDHGMEHVLRLLKQRKQDYQQERGSPLEVKVSGTAFDDRVLP
ncbi:hypothetical protein EDD86DRAFT_185613 [Gorgonomyces haynaldii]|nr:hypothetical protein EDD86DRAFT_185613 [Gorgonomyces haynaldii]